MYTLRLPCISSLFHSGIHRGGSTRSRKISSPDSIPSGEHPHDAGGIEIEVPDQATDEADDENSEENETNYCQDMPWLKVIVHSMTETV